MNRQRRQFVSLLPGLGLGAAGVTSTSSAIAQGTETPLRVLVGFPPGGSTDTVARKISARLGELLHRTVVVENRSGAGGMIATQQLKVAPPDGSVVMLTMDHTQMIIPLTFKAPGYEALADFTPLAGVTTNPLSMAVTGKIGVKTFEEYATWQKAHPEQSSFGVPAPGSIPQFAGLLVGKAIGVNLTPVPYRGGAPLVSDLIGGQVPMGIQAIAEQIEHHRRGTLHILAISGAHRSKVAPEIPTFQELGVKGIERDSWTAFFGPKGLSQKFVDQFSRAVEVALAERELVEQFAKIGHVAEYAAPAQLIDWVSSGTRGWGAVIRESGFQLQ